MQEGPFVKSFWFRKEGGLEFVPGQHVILKLDTVENDARGKMRQFCISSTPSDEGVFRITTTVEHGDSPFKRTLDSLRSGENAEVMGPLGTFTLDRSAWQERDVVLIAEGIGITPYMSMIPFALENLKKVNIELFYSSRLPESFVFLNNLKHFETTHGNFQLKLYSTESPSGVKDVRTGRVGRKEIEDNLDRWNDPVFYISGPPKRVSEISDLLKSELSIPRQSVKMEQFTGY